MAMSWINQHRIWFPSNVVALAPKLRDLFPATCIASRPSRRGEVALRNNRLGSVVSLWFKQLRRLQSYKQAIEGGKTTSSALTYRIELWSSILAAKGFSGPFRQWWNEFGRHGDPDAPSFLPSGPPARELAGLIFVSFKTCFEACESWHLHQRLKLLRAKHDRTLHALFVDLKPPSKAHLDVLWQEQCYSVIGADSDSQQLHLDRPLALGGSSTWTIDDVRVSVLSEGNDVCTVVPFPADPCEVVLVQHQTLTQLSDLHEELCHFWLPRWQQFEDLPSDRWDRIIGFFRAYFASTITTCATFDFVYMAQCPSPLRCSQCSGSGRLFSGGTPEDA